MKDAWSWLIRFTRELKRRRVLRVAGVYAVIAFVVWQVAVFPVPVRGADELEYLGDIDEAFADELEDARARLEALTGTEGAPDRRRRPWRATRTRRTLRPASCNLILPARHRRLSHRRCCRRHPTRCWANSPWSGSLARSSDSVPG